jgi:four helix bundle protein
MHFLLPIRSSPHVMSRSNFEKLKVYPLSEMVADHVWELVHQWPQFAKSSIGDQLVRSADGIGANIAEGVGQKTTGANKYHIRIARGSLYETKHWLRRAYRRGLLTDEQVADLKPLLDELAPRLNAYLNSIG